ncbi:MAG: hypothetical protein DWQ37_21510 [Planctomycetota bacterium]|nr:MAG: hypothetical protein DWQ37_21510 [Planctomycetota bacterium]
MTYSFPPDVARLVSEQLSTGQFASEDEVLREALQALKWRTAETAAIAEGVADMEAGRVRELSEIDAKLRQKHNLPKS